MKKRTMIADKNTVFGTLEDAKRRYSLGEAAIRQIAKEANAHVKIGKSSRYHFGRMDEYLLHMMEEQNKA